MILLDVLAASTRTLDVCVFTIACNELRDALIGAMRRGVCVRVITDDEKSKDRGPDIGALREASIDVRQDASPAHMHHKFAIVDGALVCNGRRVWLSPSSSSDSPSSSSSFLSPSHVVTIVNQLQ